MPSLLFSYLSGPRPQGRCLTVRGLRLGGLLALTLVLGFAPVSVQAVESVPDDYVVTLPDDLSKLQFYLITVDVGNHLWDNFGHTALRMVDDNNLTDTVFNWGLFDTSDGLLVFSFNFFKGIMNYQLGTFPPRNEFAQYRNEERTVWQDRINLNNAEKAVLFRRLMWNLEPENIVYPYQYFFDNCTTRVRDYLDEALGGRIHAATQGPTAHTFRDMVLYHYQTLGVIELSLDILMNSNIDRTISEWEEMFLPWSLRTRLMRIPADVTVDGLRPQLLSDSETLFAFPVPEAQTNPYYVAATGLLIPIALLSLMLRRIPMSYFATHSRISLRYPGFSFRLLGLVGVLTALCAGIFGCMMLGGWFFSGHEDLFHNWNLLLFWPTDFLGVLVAGRWLLQARPWPMTHNTAPFINHYLFFKLLGLAAYAVVAGLGIGAQSLFDLLVYLVPGLFLLTVLTWTVGFEPARPRHLFF